MKMNEEPSDSKGENELSHGSIMDSIIYKGKSMDRPSIVNKEIEHEFR